MASAESASRKRKKARRSGLEESPQLATVDEVASKFGVKPTDIRRWARTGVFPLPHSAIGRTLFYRADVIDHKLRTGNWPHGVKFHHPLSD